MESKLSFAALYHGIEWKCPTENITISDGVVIGNLKSSPLLETYQRLCSENIVDEGGPFDYEVYALFRKRQNDEILYDFGSSIHNVVEQFANVLALKFGRPIPMCRLLWSYDNFKTIAGTELIYYSSDIVDDIFWDKDRVTLSNDNIVDIKNIWRNVRTIYKQDTYRGRLVNALRYYYYTWRSDSLEQIVINLAIILELIFAPHSQAELTHQISFNFSRYMGKTKNERVDIYNTIKTFYRIRSAIIHGGMPNEDKIISVALSVYELVTSLMISILSDVKIIEMFSDDKQRKNMLLKFLFD
jgi:hypothetical protein